MPAKHMMQDRLHATPICTVCGGCGASLSQECPGHFLSEEQAQELTLGTLDYRDRRWVQVANSAYAFRLRLDELRGLAADSSRTSEIQTILAQSDYVLDDRLGCIPKEPLVIGRFLKSSAA